jgi:TPR repeat protein
MIARLLPLTLSVFLVASSAAVVAPTVESAMRDYTEHRYEEAARKLQVLAGQGNAEAQYNLGLLYRRGHGVPQDLAQALVWYKKAAEQGYPLAENNLGFMYTKGLGVPEDKQEGFKWYMAAAAHNFVMAQYNVGLKLFYGEGVQKNLDQSFQWFMKAADRGCREAMNFAGYMYENGLGTASDPPRAVLWYRLATDAGEQKSKDSLARMTQQNGSLVEKALSLYPEFKRSVVVDTLGVDPGSTCAWL